MSGQAKEGAVQGLECRRCGCVDFRVIYTRKRIRRIERRRECRNCGLRVSTWERVTGQKE